MARPARAQAPPLLPLLLPLLLLLLAVGAGCSAPPRGARQLCHFELPTDAQCSIEAPATGSCEIHRLPKGSCFEVWPDCWDNSSFIESINFTQHFDEERNTTSLEIYNYKGKRLLITTMQPNETWWQVDVSDVGMNISITGLSGHLNETTPLTNTVSCIGCPPPRISYIALRNMHKFEIFVSSLEEQNFKGFVSVLMASSNKTNNSINNCDYVELAARGKTDDRLLIEEVYSTEFCFVIQVNRSDIDDTKFKRRYRCKLQENMTELPFRPVQTAIHLPVWWVMGLVFLIVCLVLGSLVPLAVHKGVVRMQCGSSARRRDGDGLEGERRRPHADAVRPLLDAALAAAGTTCAHGGYEDAMRGERGSADAARQPSGQRSADEQSSKAAAFA